MSLVSQPKPTFNWLPSSYLKTPKGYVLMVVLILSVIAGFGSNDFAGFKNVGIAVFTAVLLDVLFALRQNRKRIFPDGSVITGLIIGIILSPATPWYLTVVTSMFGIISKHLFKLKRKPIFNPAAFGLFAACFLSAGQSWWAALPELPGWCIVFLLVGGFMITKRINKFPLVFAFLGVYFLVVLFMGLFNVGDALDALRTPYVNSTLFLAFFMLTDPPTSPVTYKQQIIFGGLAALVALFIYVQFQWLGFLLLGLLAANVWFTINKSLK
ncbi:RnfABCDGE type electron transport complex subunit D [Aneurinibacillus sp. Ricciae_BoGa-3]|uniref:RnfABCDGE type electron transport complex subunit D n=1 Tax=Aneurinibacillus sp. Ricciae_BoGa-3 TaxID=3022697 RepID=UPI002341E5E5|nr:RnfABCDGE type electron transport complex subunit D [Aneurinibacillus sp. Ricciae_BoGa-3]WCK54568.1 RnfABCDGE type electron transport complex subunit D [Aneurinibacillus sp. Ricciae_BoGa-3]